MPPPAPAAPPAAAAAPAAAAPPSSAPAAPPAQGAGAAAPKERDPSEWMADVGAELEDLDASQAQPRVGKKDGTKPAAGKAGDAPAADAAAAAAGAKPGDKPAEGQPDKLTDPNYQPTTTKELRELYNSQKKVIREELRPKLTQAEARIKELESATPVDVAPLQQKLTSIEKRNAELESEIQFTNYAKSKEFQEKYAAPYLKAWQKAISDLDELTVELPGGETRKASQEDLLMLSQLPLGEARKQANAMFGDAADDVMAHRRAIRELSDAQNAALENARKTSGEKAKEAELAKRTNSEAIGKLWQKTNAEWEAKSPKWVAQVKGDEELSKLHTEGLSLADRLFSPTAENRPKTAEEMVRMHTEIRQKIANHGPLLALLKRTRQELKEAKAAIAQYETSDPNGGLGGGPGGSGTADDPNAEIDALDAKGR